MCAAPRRICTQTPAFGYERLNMLKRSAWAHSVRNIIINRINCISFIVSYLIASGISAMIFIFFCLLLWKEFDWTNKSMMPFLFFHATESVGVLFCRKPLMGEGRWIFMLLQQSFVTILRWSLIRWICSLPPHSAYIGTTCHLSGLFAFFFYLNAHFYHISVPTSFCPTILQQLFIMDECEWKC